MLGYVKSQRGAVSLLGLCNTNKRCTNFYWAGTLGPQCNPYTHIRLTPAQGMVHANVGHEVTLITLSKGYFCTNFYIRWSRDVTSPSTTTQETTNKHHHHGDGATRPSSGVDSMIPCHPRGGWPCACSFQGCC